METKTRTCFVQCRIYAIIVEGVEVSPARTEIKPIVAESLKAARLAAQKLLGSQGIVQTVW